ncbi:TetR/AcrR family transcriptional regulator [Mesorhizobium sp. M7A.F.Ca.CA.001.09.2.1]|uniref:TetR/AcrR family transcriptional regulator n=2 Tax=Mesorhizobium TaxID=68287 RepID=A0AB38T8P5_9HYPH|nr:MULTISPECIES: TetR/AcrR family transcriptional regulator [Mesorhizobium]RUY58353.1 TetR/AcrR family transcriptional regulator [Mesorhizobium sp. M7A.F.Ca.CA.001.13.2.1]RVA48611.1 TetR/AcrR family transcriptional regulator [Mesorhizobium sp. M7A.F.Ca.US.001.01.1.1]MDF3216621.1 TetR/AcrR family transcriptional regulator [Mesorhizobium ciceri]RUY66282.1 TetR/AcrR family transcriptional regulator [Mesorhizobium sp. M7A.F.Ca.CA.001.05.1.1]RUY67399.1 TetR/AcrR family transcriptional regulator [Me
MARTAGSDGEKTEATIREAAVNLIARFGYEAMSMRQLAAEVGVQAAALYRYFPTKEELLFTLMREHMEGLTEAWETARPVNADPVQRLSAYVENHITFHIERRHATHVSNMELRSLSPERLTQILRMRTAYEKELRTILRDGAETGAFSIDDTGLTAMALIQMMTGVIVWFRPGERLSIGEVTTRYLSMTMRLVGAKIDAYSAARPFGRAKDAAAF